MFTKPATDDTRLTVGGAEGLLIVNDTVPLTTRARPSSTPLSATDTVLLPPLTTESGAKTLKLPPSKRSHDGTELASTKLHTGLNDPVLTTTLEPTGIVAFFPATAALLKLKLGRTSIALSTLTNTVTCVVPLAFVAPIFSCLTSEVAPGVIAPRVPESSPVALSKLNPAPSAANCTGSTEYELGLPSATIW